MILNDCSYISQKKGIFIETFFTLVGYYFTKNRFLSSKLVLLVSQVGVSQYIGIDNTVT